MAKKKIQTIRDLYNSLPDNVAYAVLGKYYYKWSSDSVPEDERHLCTNIGNVLEELGYELIDEDMVGYYNDINGYMGCQIRAI